MTREEYDKLKNRPCDRCRGQVVIEHNQNNNAEQVVCSKCKNRLPWREFGVVNLKQNNRKPRTDYPMGEELDAVWERFDDRCLVCGITTDECRQMNVGRQRQHVSPYAKEGHKGPIVPICTNCHPIATALQKNLDNQRANLMRAFGQFSRTHGELTPVGRPALSQSGVSPDSMRPAPKAATGLLERLSDDDAND